MSNFVYVDYVGNVASFSNAARRRLIKSMLTAGMPGNYVANIRKVRNKTGTNIQSNSPIVRELANRQYITDPEDLRYIQGLADKAVRSSTPDGVEKGFATVKMDNVFSPTRKAAKNNFYTANSMSLGGTNIVHLPNEKQTRPGKAFIQGHTHPAVDTSTPSIQDLMGVSGARSQRIIPGLQDRFKSGNMQGIYRDWRRATPMLEPKAASDNFVMHHSAPNKVDVTYYTDTPRTFTEDKSRWYSGKKAQNKIVSGILAKGDLVPKYIPADEKALNVINYLGSNTENLRAPLQQHSYAVNKYYMTNPDIYTATKNIMTGGRGKTHAELNTIPGFRSRQKLLTNTLMNINTQLPDYKVKSLGSMQIQ